MTGPRLRVMSYNIRNGRGVDQRVDLDRIADVIAPFAPDVVALQEVDVGRARSGGVDQAAALGERLGLVASFAPCIEDGCERYGIATLTRWQPVSVRQLALPVAEPRGRRVSEPRCALLTRLNWAETASELAVVNTHLSIKKGERAGQVAALLAGLDADEVVIAGDFNCTPWSAPFRTLAGTLRQATRRARTWPARLPIVPLDHILYRGPLHVVHSGVWTQGAARRASDHLPVVAELEYETDVRGAA
ncbi:MAG TPA: endonuclease/exonuclease/phosphatase family protein [Kofleriaceae bacterium]